MRAPRRDPEHRVWQLSDGYRVHSRVWPATADADPPAFMYFHGIQSHGGWFEWSAACIAQACGGALLLPDRRGSGMNGAARGDTPGGDRWLLDVDELADAWSRELKVQTFGLVGVSWGGKIAAAWALRNPTRVSRVLLIAPGVFPAVGYSALRQMAVGVSLLAQPERLYPIPLNEPALFTDNPAGQAFIRNDTRKLTDVTARFLYYSRRLDRQLVRAAARSLQAPVTLALAENDAIVRNRPTVAWLQRVCSRPPTVRLFPGASHTLEFGADVGAYETLLARWASGAAIPADCGLSFGC